MIKKEYRKKEKIRTKISMKNKIKPSFQNHVQMRPEDRSFFHSSQKLRLGKAKKRLVVD